MLERRAGDDRLSADGPRDLPYCAYPRVREVAQHGVQPLPAALPLVDFTRAQPYRSRLHTTISAACLSPSQLLQIAEVVGTAFVTRETMTRHIQPPRYPPAGLMEARHMDPLGSDLFGPWTKERLQYWFVRLVVLTDPTAPKSAVQVSGVTLARSLVIVDQAGQVIGAALNETMPPLGVRPAFREDDLFLTAVFSFLTPILTMLGMQDAEALPALCTRYPAFREAYARGKVGHHFMVARSENLTKADTFELVAASAQHFQEDGYEFMAIEATNPWTGAACEALGGVRVHFEPYQGRHWVQKSAERLEGIATSASGWISDKDSGSMFYVIRLA